MEKKIRLGIIGIGNMGSAHSRNILEGKCPEIELAAVADIKPARLEWAKENLPETVARFNTAEAMLDSGRIDAVLVSVPHYFHPTYAIESMKRGLHVVVEKPAGVYTKQVREMNEVAKNSNVVFAMMFNQRTNCVYRKLREMVQSGDYGNIRRVTWIVTNWYRNQAYYNSGDWRATWSGEGGGVLMNQAPHNLDMLQWICGMPNYVDAHMQFGKWHDIEVEDDVTAYLEFPNGATGMFITSTGDAPGENRFEILTDKGKFLSTEDKLYFDELDVMEPEFNRTATEGFKAPGHALREIETDGQNPQHPAILNAFAAAILRGEPLVAKGEEGINGLTLANAMYLSKFLGKPIEIPFDEDLYFEELQKRVATSKRKENVTEQVFDTEGSYSFNQK